MSNPLDERYKYLTLKLSQYDVFVLTLDVLESLEGEGGFIGPSELDRIEEILPLVEPLLSTIENLKKKIWTIERAKNLINITRHAIAQQVAKVINGNYTRILTLGLPTVLETSLQGAVNLEIRCFHPMLGGEEIPGFVERCDPFFRHTTSRIVHLAQCWDQVEWADAIFIDTFGAGFSAFVREGTNTVVYLAYGKKPLFLLMAECYQWRKDKDLFGKRVAPDNFGFLVTENGLFEYASPGDPLKSRWTFSRKD